MPIVTTNKSTYQIGVDSSVNWVTSGWTENFTLYAQGVLIRVSDGKLVMAGNDVQLSGVPQGGSGSVPLLPEYVFTPGTYILRLLSSHSIDSAPITLVVPVVPPPPPPTGNDIVIRVSNEQGNRIENATVDLM